MISVENAKFGTTLLELLHIHGDGFSGGRGDVGNVNFFQI